MSASNAHLQSCEASSRASSSPRNPGNEPAAPAIEPPVEAHAYLGERAIEVDFVCEDTHGKRMRPRAVAEHVLHRTAHDASVHLVHMEPRSDVTELGDVSVLRFPRERQHLDNRPIRVPPARLEKGATLLGFLDCE